MPKASSKGSKLPIATAAISATFTLSDGGSVTLREIAAGAEPGDAEAIGVRLAGMDPWARYGFGVERLAGFLRAGPPGAPRLLIRDGDRIAGVVALKTGWMFGTYLNLLAVLPEQQGRGIGGHVLDWLEAFGRARHDRNQFVVTSAFNSGGLRFYERHGFVQIAEMPGLIADSESEILLRKRL